MKKLFTANYCPDYLNWILPIGFEHTKNLEEADCIFFSGGEDVDPSIYGQPKHRSTYSNLHRDNLEKRIFDFALNKQIPMLGVCRGSQFLCAMSGGILVQDQDNTYLHKIKTYDGKEFVCNSTHHQAQYIWEMPEGHAKLIAWSQGVSPTHLGGIDEELVNNVAPDGKECEIVFYPKTKALGIQCHPEMLYDELRFANFIEYCQGLVKKFILNQ